MENADNDHALGATVQATVDDSGDLVPTVEDTRVREDGHATRGECRREIPLPPALEAFEHSAFAQRLVLRTVEQRGSAL